MKIYFRHVICAIAPAIIFLSITASFSIASARPDCATLFKVGQGHQSIAYKNSENGKFVYERLQQVLSSTSTDFSDLVEKAISQNWNEKKLLEELYQDRLRIVKVLREVRDSLPKDDAHRVPIQRIIELMAPDDGKYLGDTEKLQALIQKGGHLSVSEVDRFADKNQEFDPNKAEILKDLQDFAVFYHAKTHSYVAELVTAYEMQGLYGMSIHLADIFTPEQLAKVERRLKAIGKENILGYELDVLSYVPSTHTFVWVEVKHTTHRVDSNQSSKIGKWRGILKKYREAIHILNNDPVLKQMFSFKIELHFIVRGGGIDQGPAQKLGDGEIDIHDGSVEKINRRISEMGYNKTGSD